MNFMNIMISISIMSMCWWRKNLIPMLMSLELLIISLFLTLLTSISFSSLSSMLIILVLMVSGSSLGLSLLVSMSHSHKSSMSSYMNMMTFDKIYYSINSNNFYPLPPL
uniref:NADH dehydrogenase subunit 4L n=1 Tax=Plator insolens TaxID=2880587 RepID=UPI001F131B3A|nr:NADH dehydrogenase subunit 4L [Plator insolens]UMI39152.1 NADH dehydrogenase subunit 4L [Plator insolens]